MSDDKNNTAKSTNNAEEQMDLASKPVVDAEAIYGKPPEADKTQSESGDKAATEKEG